MNPTERYRLALQSPVLVGDKDRDGWVGLFDPERGFVEDPVEAGRYQGRANIEMFWDVFIGPQPSVRFDVERDFWAGDTLVRQCTVVNITQAHPDRTLRVPALIRYTLAGDRVGSLRAVWEPRGVVSWFFGMGGRGLWALGRHGLRMTTTAGLGNALSFGRTLMGSLRRPQAEALVEGLRSGEARRWTGLARTRITVGDGDESQTFEGDTPQAFERLDAVCDVAQLRLDQLLVCGHHVGAFLKQPGGDGALAVMLRTEGPERVHSMTALWSPKARVLEYDAG